MINKVLPNREKKIAFLILQQGVEYFTSAGNKSTHSKLCFDEKLKNYTLNFL